MQYRWEDYCLDRNGALLMLRGEPIDVSRRQLDCMTYLIEQRHRVVGYDELIEKIWGHDNVTNHQLSQMVLATRRALGDDGQGQRMIRTARGLGYRWVSAITVTNDPAFHSAEPSIETLPPLQAEVAAATLDDSISASTLVASTASSDVVDGRHAGTGRTRSQQRIGWIAASVLAFSGFGAQVTIRDAPAPPIASPTSTTNTDQIAALDALMDAGKYEDVRQGLARLPPNISSSQDAKLLEVRLDMARGRTGLALQKLEEQKTRADVAKDPLWQARIMTVQSTISYKEDEPPAEIRATAQSALDLLASMGDAAPPKYVSAALVARAMGLAREGRSDEAMRDYVKARDIRLSIGDQHGAARVRGNIARALIGVGHLREALDELQAALDSTRRSENIIVQIYTLNTMSRVHVELLQWDAALSANDEALRLLRQAPESDRRHRALMMRTFILSEKGRLHEAAAQLEEARQSAASHQSATPSIDVMHQVASGNATSATRQLQRSFDKMYQSQRFTPLLEDDEGLLLLWMLATRDLAAEGKPVPDLPAAPKRMILQPKTPTGHIARGRWHWAQGNPEAAEADFRLALQETRRTGHSYRMTLAAEALIELLLQRGDADGARIVLEDIRAQQPTYADRDYRTSLMALHVAHALNDPAQIRAGYARVRTLAGERSLPAKFAQPHAQYSLDSGSAQGDITIPDAVNRRSLR
jgi:DNA-binding winged helix-turn-helix (wHTH) protein/tetratricopeptide (TPR) repeat protein